jgi:hypothetical protein
MYNIPLGVRSEVWIRFEDLERSGGPVTTWKGDSSRTGFIKQLPIGGTGKLLSSGQWKSGNGIAMVGSP